VFSIFKAKPKLSELIPDGFVDIHSHVLYGLDDGAKNVKDSAFILQSMIDIGISKSITTPHTITNVWENTSESIDSSYNKLKNELPELTSKLELKVASEYLMDYSFMELFQNKPLLTLKDKFVLVEMSYMNPPIQLFEIIFQLQVAGYIPVLAHPERYAFYHNDFEMYKKLKNAGCYFQINLLSTVGYYGNEVAITTQKLLTNGMIDFAGSDIHHKNHIDAFSRNVIVKNFENLITIMKNNSIFN
jgi:tyrosine-protein phosphatase YwqE